MPSPISRHVAVAGLLVACTAPAAASDLPFDIAPIANVQYEWGRVDSDLGPLQTEDGFRRARLGLRIKDKLLRSGFDQRFVAKGRFQQLMAAIPVKLITHPQPGLFGAAAAFAQEHT